MANNNNNDREYLSKEKLKELELELETLSTTKRRDVAEQLEQAKSLGDLRENSEYQEARAAQATLEERIAYLTDVVKRAVVVQSHHSTKVEIGSTVVIRKKGGIDSTSSENQKLHVVGSSEANIHNGNISNESPVGHAMMGKSKGDTFTVNTSKGQVEYSVIDIE